MTGKEWLRVNCGIGANIARVRERIAQAALRAGRDPASVKLIAVSKTKPVSLIAQAVESGIEHLGENHAQELVEKAPRLSGPISWHFIGQLQTNKVKYVIDHTFLLHSVDRISLAEELERQAARKELRVRALAEVNVAGEASKAGFSPDELRGFLEWAGTLRHLEICGLMTIAPIAASPQQVRPVFAELRRLSEQMNALSLPGVELRELSMGMTDDFEVAVEEGTNWVRIGRAIFGER